MFSNWTWILIELAKKIIPSTSLPNMSKKIECSTDSYQILRQTVKIHPLGQSYLEVIKESLVGGGKNNQFEYCTLIASKILLSTSLTAK